MIKELEKLGLNQKQAKIYLTCLRLGEARIQEIVRETNIKRSTVYIIVDSLKKLGLIKHTKRQKTNLYLAEKPSIIRDQLEEKQKIFNTILPQLQSLNNILRIKPKLTYIEGKENLKQSYIDTTKYKNKPIYAWCSADSFSYNEDFIGLEFIKDYIQKRIDNKNYLYMIIEPHPGIIKEKINDQKELRQMRFFQNKNPLKIDIFIYGDKEVTLFSCPDNLALTIESQFINQGLKKIFLEMWNLI